MSPRLPVLLCLAVLVVGCAGHGGGADAVRAPIMSPSDFYGFCSALPTPGACVSDPICLRYRRELTSPPAALPDCLELCKRTENDLYVGNMVNGCAYTLERAADLCDQFCRRRDPS